MNISVRDPATVRAERSNRRAQLMKNLRQWHWISGAVSLISMLLFAVTGITLNHSSVIESKPKVRTVEATLDRSAIDAMARAPNSGRAPLPSETSVDVARAIGVDVAASDAEWSDEEAYVALPRPGGDAWISLNRKNGKLTYEDTDRGWIALFNDLHKGRNAGVAWGVFIDVFALCCIAFCVTGLLLLQLYAKGRPSTWPVVGLGVAIPLFIAIYFLH